VSASSFSRKSTRRKRFDQTFSLPGSPKMRVRPQSISRLVSSFSELRRVDLKSTA
jgi:hypothetical protein